MGIPWLQRVQVGGGVGVGEDGDPDFVACDSGYGGSRA